VIRCRPFAGDTRGAEATMATIRLTVGIGRRVSTKFTGRMDPKPKDAFLLTRRGSGRVRHWIR